MITPDYCLAMARYNAWQNTQLKSAFETLDHGALTEDRGAFFGSILGTANHLLWADRMWLSRLTGRPQPEGSIETSVDMTERARDWALERFRTDSALLIWAEGLRAVTLTGPLRWYSGASGRDVEQPRGLCIAHMFNHQTHHRGQIHAMLTQAGAKAPVTDLFLMPTSGPWL